MGTINSNNPIINKASLLVEIGLNTDQQHWTCQGLEHLVTAFTVFYPITAVGLVVTKTISLISGIGIAILPVMLGYLNEGLEKHCYFQAEPQPLTSKILQFFESIIYPQESQTSPALTRRQKNLFEMANNLAILHGNYKVCPDKPLVNRLVAMLKLTSEQAGVDNTSLDDYLNIFKINLMVQTIKPTDRNNRNADRDVHVLKNIIASITTSMVKQKALLKQHEYIQNTTTLISAVLKKNPFFAIQLFASPQFEEKRLIVQEALSSALSNIETLPNIDDSISQGKYSQAIYNLAKAYNSLEHICDAFTLFSKDVVDALDSWTVEYPCEVLLYQNTAQT